MHKNVLAIGITILFIITAVTPMTLGYDVETNEEDEYLKNLAFVCSDRYDSSKLAYYKEILQKFYSEDIESKKHTIPNSQPLIEKISGPMDSSWPMKCHDNYHTSRSPYSTINTTSLEKWRFKGIRMVDSAAIDNDGTIYCGTRDYNMYALNPNGTLKWKYKTGEWITSAPAISADGTVYIGSWDTKLYAINPNGTLKWKIGTGGIISSSPAIAEDGAIYIGNLGKKIVAINPDGTIKWTYNTGYMIASDPAIGDDGTIYIGSGDTYLYAMNPNGTLKWRFETGDEIHSHPSIGSDGTIYFGSNDKYFYALYPNGSLKWKFPIPSGLYNSASIGGDGTIYAADEYLYAIYPNGTINWTFNFGYERWVSASSPAISADGTIYVGTHIGNMAGGEIVAVNPDGSERWRKKIANDWVDSSPAIAEDGTVYIGSSSDIEYEPGKWKPWGYLHAFGPVDSSNPPNTPTIEGPTSGKAGEEYGYYFTSIDPDNNPVSFYIDWGDGSNTGWTREVASGEKAMFKHIFFKQGNYTIQAKAKDTLDEESDWAALEVTIPRNKAVSNSWFQWFLERFPLLERLLNLLR